MNMWAKQLLKSLDENLDERSRIKIMETCDEECPFTHLTDEKLLEIRKVSIEKTVLSSDDECRFRIML